MKTQTKTTTGYMNGPDFLFIVKYSQGMVTHEVKLDSWEDADRFAMMIIATLKSSCRFCVVLRVDTNRVTQTLAWVYEDGGTMARGAMLERDAVEAPFNDVRSN